MHSCGKCSVDFFYVGSSAGVVEGVKSWSERGAEIKQGGRAGEGWGSESSVKNLTLLLCVQRSRRGGVNGRGKRGFGIRKKRDDLLGE